MTSQATAHRIGRAFVICAIVEAITWVGLLIGMLFKYVVASNEVGVQIFGPIHGAAFMIYVVVTLVAAVTFKWRWWVTLIALAAAIPPLATIWAERWITRRGDLATPAPATASA